MFGQNDEVKLLRAKIQYADDESYFMYIVKHPKQEKPIGFLYIMPPFTDINKDITISFETNGKIDNKIQINPRFDKSEDTV